jgi:LDH2 family malate/lactate/ureidoglycolate dehydrogenase
MRSKYAERDRNDERLEIALPAQQKRLAFEIARREGITVSELIRTSIKLAAADLSINVAA